MELSEYDIRQQGVFHNSKPRFKASRGAVELLAGTEPIDGIDAATFRNMFAEHRALLLDILDRRGMKS